METVDMDRGASQDEPAGDHAAMSFLKEVVPVTKAPPNDFGIGDEAGYLLRWTPIMRALS
jgi:hypothetical protein